VHLLLDSSGMELVCALGDSQGIIVEERYPTGTLESRDIGAVAGRILGEILVRELESVTVGTGPGSFIGTRVAISYANGLAVNSDVRLGGVNSLAAIAALHGTGGSCVIRDARRGEVYLYSASSGKPVTELVNLDVLDTVLKEKDISNVVIEQPTADQPRLQATFENITQTCSEVGLPVTSCPGVPAEGLRRMVSSLQPVDYIEPEYLRSFL